MGKPAARVGDMHTCPLPIHVGGPVLAPGKTNVMIGGMPAATVDTKCTCVGPLDVIVEGSSSVFIGGRPAARKGDATAHGGKITAGCSSVLIGDNGSGEAGGEVTLKNRANSNLRDRPNVLGGGVGGGGSAATGKAARDAAKKERYEARLALIASGRQRAKALRDDPRLHYDPYFTYRQLRQAADISNAANRLERTNKAIERVRVTNDVYNIWDKDGNPVPLPASSPPDGWRITESHFDKKTGFAYAVYEPNFEKPSKPVLVFRGTQTKQDWDSNGKQAIGIKDEQYEESIKVAQSILRNIQTGLRSPDIPRPVVKQRLPVL